MSIEQKLAGMPEIEEEIVQHFALDAELSGREHLKAIYASLARFSMEERGHYVMPELKYPLVLVHCENHEWIHVMILAADVLVPGIESTYVKELHPHIVNNHLNEILACSREKGFMIRSVSRDFGLLTYVADDFWEVGTLSYFAAARMVEEWSSDGRAALDLMPERMIPLIRPLHWALALRGEKKPGAIIVERLRLMIQGELAEAEKAGIVHRRVGKGVDALKQDEDLPRHQRTHRPRTEDRPAPQSVDHIATLAHLDSMKVAHEARSQLTLSDCPGMGAEAEEWASDLCRDLNDYKAGSLPWSEIDRGILLAGPPGVGKTRFAECLANSAGVSIVATSAAQWISGDGDLGKYVGAMRRAAEDAAKKAPCILFIDEIDACGNRQESGKNSGWMNAAVAALLEVLDGHNRRDGVVVVAATNKPDNIDPALKRPGRLDRLVHISLPSTEALDKIFRVHLAGTMEDQDLSCVTQKAFAAEGTGAAIERWCREARRRARRARREMEIQDLLNVIPEPVEERTQIGFRIH